MRASFSKMSESTAEDFQVIIQKQMTYIAKLPDRILSHMELLRDDFGGFPIDRLQHCLQTATLAAEANEDEEYIVCALLHDIGDILGSTNHADVSAAILKPFVSEANHWTIKHHAIFQGYNFFHFWGMDRNMRDKYRDCEHFERTVKFVEKYDNPAFDSRVPELSLSVFEPVLRNVFSKPKHSIYKKAIGID